MPIEKHLIKNMIDITLSNQQRIYIKTRWYTSLMIGTIFVLLKSSPAVSQQAECSCTPLKYRWFLNFTNPCPPANMVFNPGIIFCDIDDRKVNTGNAIPVIVTAYQLREFSADTNTGAIESNNNASLYDGDYIDFVSETMANPEYISAVFLVQIIGRNAADERVELGLLVNFTNVCEQPPFQVGDSIGWITYGPDTPFRPNTCLLPSNAPSSIPTSVLPSSKEPSFIPTRQPSRKPKNKKKVNRESKKSKKEIG